MEQLSVVSRALADFAAAPIRPRENAKARYLGKAEAVGVPVFAQVDCSRQRRKLGAVQRRKAEIEAALEARRAALPTRGSPRADRAGARRHAARARARTRRLAP